MPRIAPSFVIGVALVGAMFPGSAEVVHDEPTGLAIDPPAGYTAQRVEASRPYAVVFDVKTAADRNGGCRVGFQRIPDNNDLSQEELNDFVVTPEWSNVIRAILAYVYEVRSIEPFEHAGVRGAVIVANLKQAPNTPADRADIRTLLIMLETPKGRTTAACVDEEPRFTTRRPEFEAVARSVTLPR